MLSSLKTRFSDRLDEHMIEVIRGAGVALVLKVAGAVLQFGFSVLLAHNLGAEGAGIYYLALTVCTVAWILGCFGLDNTVLRFVAAHASRLEWGSVKGVYRKAITLASFSSVSLSAFLFCLAPYLAESLFEKSDLVVPLRYMSLAVWPMTMVFLHGEAIKGLKRIRDSQLVNGVFVPMVALSGLLLVGDRFGVLGAVGAFGLAAFIAAGAGFWFWSRATTQLTTVQANFDNRTLMNSCLPLFLASGSYLVMNWSSTFALGIWGTKADVGVFSVALRTANLTSFILVSVNSILAPKFSELYSKGDMRALGSTARKSTLLMTCFASPILLVFWIVPDSVMGLFGTEFHDGGYLLSIIAVGQFINVASGSVGFLLSMSGREHLIRNSTVFVALMTIVMNMVMVPIWGSLGAALATSLAMAMVNLISFYLVWKSMGIVTIPGFSRASK